MTDKRSLDAKSSGGISDEMVEAIKQQVLSGASVEPKPSTRFRKGQSGNPKGRPRRSNPSDGAAVMTAQDSLFLMESRRTHRIREGEKEVKLTAEEIAIRALWRSAVNGNAFSQK